MKTEIIIMSMAALSSTGLTMNVHPFTASPEDCQKLCLLAEGCKRFDFTANKRCWLKADDQCNFKIVPGKYSGFKTGPIATNVTCVPIGSPVEQLPAEKGKCKFKVTDAAKCQEMCRLVQNVDGNGNGSGNCGRWDFSSQSSICKLRKRYGWTSQHSLNHVSGFKTGGFVENTHTIGGHVSCTYLN